MDATASALLKQTNDSLSSIGVLLGQIVTSLEPLKKLNNPQPVNFTPQLVTALLSVLSGVVVALAVIYLKEPWRRKFKKTRIKALSVVSILQGYQYIYRLVLKNDSNFAAKNVEVNVEEVYDDGNILRTDFIPAPLRWTHKSTERDIFGHQTAYLDICEVKQEQSKFIRLAAPNVIDLPSIPFIKAGSTKLRLKFYQENGQTGEITISIIWNGNETFNAGDLPQISIV